VEPGFRAVGVRERSALLEEGPQVRQLDRGPEVLLRDLQLEREPGARHRPEERVEGLARLEVEGAVLDLHHDVVPEFPVERLELVVGLVHAVHGRHHLVDERPPHHDAAVRRDGVRDHVGPVRVGASVFLRPRLALGVGLHEEAAEVGDMAVDLIRLRMPPGDDRRVQGVGGLQAAELDRRAEPGGKVDPDAVGAEHVREGRHLRQ
jgi:hypothetical protein